jgi:spore coat polysaccharide biosynthesis protein SpsF
MKIVVIIQARMGSSRLPGKVMLNLIDKPMLAHVVERCKAINSVHEVIVATTINAEDDQIQDFAERSNVYCYRCSELDVLSRFYEAATLRKADIVVRVTSDCPLIDPFVSNEVIQTFLNNSTIDFCSNTLVRSFPQGLDIEVFSYDVLERSHKEAKANFEREHVTPYIYQNQSLFQIEQYVNKVDYSNYRWTVDTAEDYKLITEIYKCIYSPVHLFSWQEGIVTMERNPSLNNLNSHIKQKTLLE